MPIWKCLVLIGFLTRKALLNAQDICHFQEVAAKIHLAHSLCAKVANPVKSVTKLTQIPLPPTSSSKEQVSIAIISKVLPFSIFRKVFSAFCKKHQKCVTILDVRTQILLSNLPWMNFKLCYRFFSWSTNFSLVRFQKLEFNVGLANFKRGRQTDRQAPFFKAVPHPHWHYLITFWSLFREGVNKKVLFE